jgi:hypothetical protein
MTLKTVTVNGYKETRKQSQSQENAEQALGTNQPIQSDRSEKEPGITYRKEEQG